MTANDEQHAVYHYQTAILTWLRSLDHQVRYNRDPSVPSIHLPPRRHHIGQPCPYCGTAMTRRGRHGVSREHILPKSRGGLLTSANRLIVCAWCNLTKSDMTLEEWYERLVRNGDPRAARVAWVIRGHVQWAQAAR